MTDAWERYQQYCLTDPDLGFSLDVSRVRFPDGWLATMAGPAQAALDAMAALEAGAIANPDENRRVGHYWLRAPQLAPTPELGAEIAAAVTAVTAFAGRVRRGEVTAAAGPFRHVIHVGIGGSANGPQLLDAALRADGDPVTVHFLDNIDPDATARLARRLGPELGATLVSVVSKSGWTPTPWLVMTELERVWAAAGLDFGRHAVATTMPGTKLDDRAVAHGWLARFPLWDWVGGRTSVSSAVGLLPAALAGIDVAELLRGAAAMDELTRRRETAANPALLLALAWHWLGHGVGDRHMVVLPYRDRLALFPRYVQQLVMESVGKRLDRSGQVVRQGINVYGHKGSTDQHAYVQQLRDGRDDTFVTFVAVERDEEPGSGGSLADHLFGNLAGTQQALTALGRDSLCLTLDDGGPVSLGALIALYERAVGLYAELIDVNAYHQPGVDKDVAAPVVALQQRALDWLREAASPATAPEIAAAIGRPAETPVIYRALRRQALRPDGCVRSIPRDERFGDLFTWSLPPR